MHQNEPSSPRKLPRATTRVLAAVPSHHDHAIGEAIGIRLEIDHVVAFPAPGGERP